PRIWRWAAIVAIAAMAGALLVLVLPSSVFAAAVPWLILLAVALIAVQPLVLKHLPPPNRWTSGLYMSGSGFYGGYFGAGQGIAWPGRCRRCGRPRRLSVGGSAAGAPAVCRHRPCAPS